MDEERGGQEEKNASNMRGGLKSQPESGIRSLF